jgi:hypothetical protein
MCYQTLRSVYTQVHVPKSISNIKNARIFYFIHLFIHQCLYSLLLGPGLFISVIIFFMQTVGFLGRGSAVARPLPTHRTTRTQNKRTYRHPCLEWDSNRDSSIRESTVIGYTLFSYTYFVLRRADY